MPAVSYAEYLNALNGMGTRYHYNDNGQDDQAMSEADWNKLPLSERINQLRQGGPAQLDTSGDLYRGLESRYRGAMGNTPAAWMGGNEGQWNPNDPDYQRQYSSVMASTQRPDLDPSRYFDPSRVWQDPETQLWLHEGSNARPDVIQRQQDAESRETRGRQIGMIGAVLGAGALGNMGLFGTEAAAANPFAGASATGSLGTDLGAGFGVGVDGAGIGAAGANPFAGATAGATGSNTFLGGPISALLEGDFAGAGTGLLNGALANPLQAAGLIQAGAGLLGGGGGGGSSPSGGGTKGGGGIAPVGNIARPTYTPNQNTLQQLQSLYGGGSPADRLRR